MDLATSAMTPEIAAITLSTWAQRKEREFRAALQYQAPGFPAFAAWLILG